MVPGLSPWLEEGEVYAGWGKEEEEGGDTGGKEKERYRSWPPAKENNQHFAKEKS